MVLLEPGLVIILVTCNVVNNSFINIVDAANNRKVIQTPKGIFSGSTVIVNNLLVNITRPGGSGSWAPSFNHHINTSEILNDT